MSKYILCIIIFCNINLYSSVLYNYYGNDKLINNEFVDIKYIGYQDYSLVLSIIDFPRLSDFLIFKDKLPILEIFEKLYIFIGYSGMFRAKVEYLNFFKTIKSIEYFFVENNKNLSVSFSYSSYMDVNYNSMIRDLSASCKEIFSDSVILLSLNYYI